jgi:hypothetical protein
MRYAISYTLSRHKDVELLLGDRLLFYNKTVQNDSSQSVVEFQRAAERIAKRKADVSALIESEIKRLPIDCQRRVRVSSWVDNSDIAFGDILRKLHICYVALTAFGECVDQDVKIHFASNLEVDRPTDHTYLSSLYILEETAMIIRITELADKPFFCYPGDDFITLHSIYDEKFTLCGLSVFNLTGRPKSRIFRSLLLPQSSEH